MARISLGKVRGPQGDEGKPLNPCGEYNPATTYNRLDLVTYENSSYMALKTTTGNTPSESDTENWQLSANGVTGAANGTTYDNTTSGLTATNTQDAIDEVIEKLEEETSKIPKNVLVASETSSISESVPKIDADRLGGELPEYYAAAQNVVDLGNKLNKIYVENEVKTPDNTGSSSLLGYIIHLTSQGVQSAVFQAENFSDLPKQNWGFTVEMFVSGALSVRAYRQLSVNEYYFRSVSYDNTWLTPWQKFILQHTIQSGDVPVDINNLNDGISIFPGTVEVEGAPDNLKKVGDATVFQPSRCFGWQLLGEYTDKFFFRKISWDGTALDWNRIAFTSMIANPNLLINPDFKINQRGNPSYSNYGAPNSYTVDRWQLNDGSTTDIIVHSDCITLSTLNANLYKDLFQRIENYSDYLGETLTLSVRAKTQSEHIQLSIYDGISDSVASINPTSDWTTTYLTKKISNSASMLRAGVKIDAGYDEQSVDIKWMKLEVGSVATKFVSPNPAEELLKCKKYYSKDKISYLKAMNNTNLLGCTNYQRLTPLRTIPTIKVCSPIGTENTFCTIFNEDTSDVIEIIHNNNTTHYPAIQLKEEPDSSLRYIIIESDAEIY